MNVDINKEVQREMMSPSQDQGIVKLLASELKARDAKARQQINNLMAGQPDPNSIMAQNEREVENSVRQEIGQKMQARVMQERQAQARQRKALAGIAGQRASNMQMAASGGIVGYAPGGDVEVGSGQPIPMLMQKYGSEKVMEFLEKEKQLKDIEGNVAPERREEFEMMKANIESLFDPQMIRDIRRARTGPDEVEMAGGGIVGFQEGGMPRFPRLFDFSMFLAEKGIDSLAGLSAEAVNRLRQEYQAMQAREMDRPRGDSVSESQMENLGGVLRGAGNVLTEGLASLAPEPQGRNRTELADMGGAPGAGGAPQARREPSAAGLADAQAEMDILNAAQRRQDEAGRRQGLEALDYYDPAEGLEAVRRGAAETRAISVDEPDEGLLGQLGRLFRPSSAQRAANRAGDAERQRQRDILAEPGLADRFVDYATRPLDELDYYDPNAPKQTDQEAAQVAREIIDTGVTPEQFDEAYRMGEGTTAPAIDRSAIDAGSALAREVETTPSGDEGAARAASVVTGRDGEAAAAELASTVARNPTPENTSRFESEIQRLMERRESPVRALSSFLTSFSQARGGSMGQNLAIATTAMRAADDALDKQIVELEKLRRADQISERDFNLKKEQVENERSYRDAMAEYYRNIPNVQKEIAQMREDGRSAEIETRLREVALAAVLPYRSIFQTEAEDELPSNATARQIQDLADRKFQTQVNMFVNMAKAPQTSDSEIEDLVRQYRSR